ncbi:DUF58 domain-containing protein [Haloarchaeobius sp. FL176]|uniref:DUF58 domain-containing protein n=1 Tax=Haloarchaeobius sp. FL176 TaxID=2967129 RepID=UPI00214899C1|nr:DUF58 domain-containing protein [Haloarchaeobius sp. FL176]
MSWHRTTTDRWRWLVPVALVLAPVGVVSASPAVVLCAVVCVGVAAFARASPAPEPSVDCERRFRERDDGTVAVSLRVENDGSAALPDVRVVDGVPADCTVLDGTPELACSLAAGASRTLRYRVDAPESTRRFDDPFVVVADRAGRVELDARVDAGADRLGSSRPLPDAEPVALRPPTGGPPGPLTGTEAGQGLAFHSVREYRRGDPLGRVDWSRFARTGDLSTVTFRAERAPTVVLVVDARPAAYVAPAPDATSARDHAVDAARTLVTGLADAQVGLAVLGSGVSWTSPGTGRTHRARLRRQLDTDPALVTPPEGDDPAVAPLATTLRARTPADAQLCLLTPLCDDAVASLARRLDAGGTPVSVVSPDPTTTDGPGPQLAHLERGARVRDLRRAGIPVLDWTEGDAREAFARAGWSR